MAGTSSRAVKNAVSCMAASALIPARSSSLFLTERPSLLARCLSASSTTYSTFGMVKLSRTNFGFLVFSSFTAWLVLTSSSCLTVARVFEGGVFVIGFLTAALALGTLAVINFFAAGLTGAGFLATGFFAVARWAAGVLASGWVVALESGVATDVVTGVAGVAFGLTVFMKNLWINGVNSLYRLKKQSRYLLRQLFYRPETIRFQGVFCQASASSCSRYADCGNA